jgi:AraC-like DNA-binding protein
MATAARHPISPGAEGSRHVDKIESAAGGAGLIGRAEEVFDSWRRCIADYHVDPKSPTSPNIITQSELSASREPVADLIVHAREEIDRLYAIVRQEEYVVLLCNSDGVAIHHRGDESKAEEFKQRGIWLGGVWSEHVEGTNGIGTAIVEKRPVLVHCGQHFRTRHTNLSCASAPIFDHNGELVAVLDASRIDSEGQDRKHRLALAAITASARAVEERLFRQFFRHAWTIAAAPRDESSEAVLLAVDEDQRIIGADHVGRLAILPGGKRLSDGAALAIAFHYDRSFFRRRDEGDLATQWISADGGGYWNILITPPLRKSQELRSWEDTIIHARPRISTLGDLPIEKDPVPSRGGLPPGLSRRICEHIDSHLDEKISLSALAAMAGLSPQHFARTFRQSVGMPPHSYLLRRRVERVELMLRDTQLPLSEIAAATGFSDQSHLARHFHRLTGVSPSVARWKTR